MSWRHLVTSKQPWTILKGPMAATQAVLLGSGWDASRFDTWFDHDGCQWHVGLSRPELLYTLSRKKKKHIT